MKKIRNKHVLIVSPGNNLKKYEDKIKKFIQDNEIVTIGANSINNVLAPDYHFWGSGHRWRKYGRFVDPKSVLIFSPGFSGKSIRKYWKKEYKTYKTNERVIGDTKKYKTIYSYFENTALVAAFWAYQKKASKISIVGMDGYSYYTEEELKTKQHAQHCYGKGFTDGQTYEYGRRKDIGYYIRLKAFNRYGKKKYGFGLEILTPTVYDKFYNPKVLDIEERYEGIPIQLEDKKKFKKDKNIYIKGSKYW